MAITKESKKILDAEILKINEALPPLQAELDKLTAQRDSYQTKIDALKTRIDYLKNTKKAYKADIDAH